LYVDYEDETGLSVEGDRRVPATAMFDATLPGNRGLLLRWRAVYLPRDLEGLLRSGFADRPEWRPHRLPDGEDLDEAVPWLLPVFVVPPERSYRLPWADLLKPLVATAGDIDARCVLVQQQPILPQPALRLPLRFEQAGPAGADWFAAVRTRSWYLASDAVRQFGIAFVRPDEAPRHDVPHVLVRPFFWPLPQRLHLETRPLLVLVIAEDAPLSALRDRLPAIEPGVSHLIVTSRSNNDPIVADEVVAQFVYALVHDFALHEIVWILRRTIRHSKVRLVSDRQAIQALRLSGVMRRVADDTLAMRAARGARSYIDNNELNYRLRDLAFDFRFESLGLTAIANFLSFARTIFGILGSSTHDSARRAVETDGEPRRQADIALEQYDAFGVLLPMFDRDRARPLRCGWRYRLRVHIGIPDPYASAMVGEVPAIDDLLPPPNDATTRSIEVAVFAKRFELLSATVQTIALPHTGASAPVYFELRAPQEVGPADLRVALYWQNNLLQSFVLEAPIADSSSDALPGDRPLVLAHLDASGIDDFTALPDVGARTLSIGFNDDARPDSHTVMIKGTGWRSEAAMTAGTADDFMDRFRDELDRADNGEPFEQTMRRLAALGHEIWDMLVLSDLSDAQPLEDLRNSAGGTVQFVRYGSGQPFPWQAVYDYGLPRGEGFAGARICYGNTKVRPFARGQTGCPHCPDQDVVCIEGFWAARHRIEMLRETRPGASSETGRAKRACAPAPNPLVMLGIGTPSGVASRFQAGLQNLFGGALRLIDRSDLPVVDLIWNPSERPAMLVVLSHLEPADRQKNLPTLLRAFDLNTQDAEISVPQFALRAREKWVEPRRPLVLLLACQSAQQRVGELTSLIDAFLQVGAAGVAGAEWNVKASVATEFGRSIIETTLGDPMLTLGESVRRYRHASLSADKALSFAFTVYGDADLTVGRP
jgi:hypothetical protein